MVLFAMMAPLAFLEDADTVFGLPGTVVGPLSLAVIFAAWIFFTSRSWRCPACDMALGRAFNPRQCRMCGIELRG